MIGVFLAILELIREKRIIARFSENSDDIAVEIAPEEHRKTFRGASLNLSDEETRPLDDQAAEPGSLDGHEPSKNGEESETVR